MQLQTKPLGKIVGCGERGEGLMDWGRSAVAVVDAAVGKLTWLQKRWYGRRSSWDSWSINDRKYSSRNSTLLQICKDSSGVSEYKE
jgi:hypothetical protein